MGSAQAMYRYVFAQAVPMLTVGRHRVFVPSFTAVPHESLCLLPVRPKTVPTRRESSPSRIVPLRTLRLVSVGFPAPVLVAPLKRVKTW